MLRISWRHRPKFRAASLLCRWLIDVTLVTSAVLARLRQEWRITARYDRPQAMNDPGPYFSLIRPHVLHRASRYPIIASWMLQELSRRGYAIERDTLTRLLNRMVDNEYLKSRRTSAVFLTRRSYLITAGGRRALAKACNRLRALGDVLFKATAGQT